MLNQYVRIQRVSFLYSFMYSERVGKGLRVGISVGHNGSRENKKINN